MQKNNFILAILCVTNSLWSMETQKTDPLLDALIHRNQRDIAKIISPHLTVTKNNEQSPLLSLFKKKDVHYTSLPEINRIPITNERIAALAMHTNKLLVTTLVDIQEIDLNTRQQKTLNAFGKGSPKTIAATSPDCSLIAHGHMEGNTPLTFYSTISQTEKKSAEYVSKDIKIHGTTQAAAIAFSSDGKLLVTASRSPRFEPTCYQQITLNWYNPQTLECIESVNIPKEAYTIDGCFTQNLVSVAVSPDNSITALLSGYQALSIFNTTTKEYMGSHCIEVPKGNERYLCDICMVDNNTIIAGAQDEYLYSHNITTQQTTALLQLGSPKEKRMISRIYALKNGNKCYLIVRHNDTPARDLTILEYDSHSNALIQKTTRKLLSPDKQSNSWNVNLEFYKMQSAVAISKDLKTIAICSPDKSITLCDTRGFFNTIINRLAKPSFAQQMLLQAYDKLLAAGKTPVKIAKDTLEEKVIKVMDPLILEILLQEKVIEFKENK